MLDHIVCPSMLVKRVSDTSIMKRFIKIRIHLCNEENKIIKEGGSFELEISINILLEDMPCQLDEMLIGKNLIFNMLKLKLRIIMLENICRFQLTCWRIQ